MKKQLTILPKIAALSVVLAFSAPVMAQSAGTNMFNVGWRHLSPQDSSEGITGVSGVVGRSLGSFGSNARTSVSNADTLSLEYTRFFTDNIALTLDAGIAPTFHLQGQGRLSPYGEIGKAKQWSPAIVAKYFFGEAKDKFRPYLGAGVTHVWYSNVQLGNDFQRYIGAGIANSSITNGTATASFSSSTAPVVTTGAIYNFDDKWSLGFSLSYIPLKTDVTVTGRSATVGTNVYQTRITFNPIVSFLSLGYKF